MNKIKIIRFLKTFDYNYVKYRFGLWKNSIDMKIKSSRDKQIFYRKLKQW